MKEYSLGDDAGLAQININGQSLTLCPVATLAEMNDAAGDKKGIPFMQSISDFLKSKFGVTASSYQADEFYRTIVKAEKEAVDFFSQRQRSSTTSEATPEAGAEPKSAA